MIHTSRNIYGSHHVKSLLEREDSIPTLSLDPNRLSCPHREPRNGLGLLEDPLLFDDEDDSASVSSP